MVEAVEGLPEDVMPVQQIEQAVYARVIAHKLSQNHAETRPVAARPKGIPLDPYTISEHRGVGLAGGIYLARGFGRAQQWPLSSVCRPYEFAAHRVCVPRNKRTVSSLSTLATAPQCQLARRRDTRAARPSRRHYPSVSRRATP